MQIERSIVETSSPPFPIYKDATADLLRAHALESSDRDPTVAHILAVLAGYAYADAETFAMMASRLGMSGSACVRIAQTVESMLIVATAYILQSPCGRLAILCYRGTEHANLANWLGDADVGSHTIDLGGTPLRVHSGFFRNVRATRWPVVEALRAAARGEPLVGSAALAHPLEALYVTGHSLGGAMAVIFALSVQGHDEDRVLRDRLRAVYTFGQPLVADGRLPDAARAVGSRLFRHVYAHDAIPALPPRVWGPLEHFGHEFHYADGRWRSRDAVTGQLGTMRDASRSVVAMFAPEKQRGSSPYTMADHGPHHYISALRPVGRVTEFGDYE